MGKDTFNLDLISSERNLKLGTTIEVNVGGKFHGTFIFQLNLKNIHCSRFDAINVGLKNTPCLHGV